MFSILEKIVFFVFIGNSMYDSSEFIGNYTKLNDKSCGISLFSSKQKLCFKYHNEMPLKLKDSRNALPGEAPWSVFLRIETIWGSHRHCSGVLIDKQWVMTVAHCLVFGDGSIRNDRIWVHLNTVLSQKILKWDSEYWSSEQKYIHPLFRWDEKHLGHAYDIGLFKLNKAILIHPGVVNSICLPPEKNFTYFEEQYAMTTGLSTVYINKYSEEPSLTRLQIANLKVSSHTNVMFLNNYPTQVVNGSYIIWPGYIFGKKIDKQKTCKGDSGSPLWQYYLGRAFLIGILSQADANFSDENKCQNEVYTGYFPNETEVENLSESLTLNTWVPMMMDWVLNVTKYN